MSDRDILDQFVASFNERQLSSLASLLNVGAVAQVVNAPFPREEGREAIMNTSIPYMAKGDLTASVVVLDGKSRVIFRTQKGDGALDAIAHIEMKDGGVERIDWITGPHCPVAMHEAGTSLGLETTIEEGT